MKLRSCKWLLSNCFRIEFHSNCWLTDCYFKEANANQTIGSESWICDTLEKLIGRRNSREWRKSWWTHKISIDRMKAVELFHKLRILSTTANESLECDCLFTHKSSSLLVDTNWNWNLLCLSLFFSSSVPFTRAQTLEIAWTFPYSFHSFSFLCVSRPKARC